MELFSKSMKCPKCGFPVLSKHTFCPKCGHALTDEAQQQVEEREESQRKQWEDQFGFESKKQQLDFDQKLVDKDSDVERDIRKDEHQQEMADREAQRNRDQQQYDFELKRAEKAADLDLNQQEKKFDFDLDQKQRDADEERSFRKDEHQQEMSDREAQRNRDQQQYDFELKRAEKAADLDLGQQQKTFDFDLDQKQRNADDERGFKRDEHQQEMSDREAQRNRDQQQFDFDLEVKKQAKADEHALRMEEHEMKMASNQQDMADREAQRTALPVALRLFGYKADRAAFGRELDRVCDDAHQHLPEAQNVADAGVFNIADDFMPVVQSLFAAQRLRKHVHEIQHVPRREGLRVQRHGAGFDVVHIQHIVDHVQQVMGAGVYLPESLPGLGFQGFVL